MIQSNLTLGEAKRLWDHTPPPSIPKTKDKGENMLTSEQQDWLVEILRQVRDMSTEEDLSVLPKNQKNFDMAEAVLDKVQNSISSTSKAKELFHNLWGKSKYSALYNKNEWMELQVLLHNLGVDL